VSWLDDLRAVQRNDPAARNVVGSGNFALEPSTLVYQFLNDRIRARIQLLQRDNRTDVISTPVLLASNNRPARIFVGEERVLVTGVESDIITPADGATTVVIEPQTEIRDVGTTLVIVPKINADRTVTMFVAHDSSSVNFNSATIPIVTDGGVSDFPIDTVDTAVVEATIVGKDGLTVALGGLIRTEVIDSEDKVPFFGDLPVLGFFFRRDEQIRAKRELILLITPRVLFTPEEGERVSRERMDGLSRHDWHEEGDGALEGHFDRVDEGFDRRHDGNGEGGER